MPRIDFDNAKPRQVEAYLREVVRKALGDEIENQSNIYSKRGYFTIHLELEKNRYVDFDNFRRTDAPRIARAIRALAAA